MRRRGFLTGGLAMMAAAATGALSLPKKTQAEEIRLEPCDHVVEPQEGIPAKPHPSSHSDLITPEMNKLLITACNPIGAGIEARNDAHRQIAMALETPVWANLSSDTGFLMNRLPAHEYNNTPAFDIGFSIWMDFEHGRNCRWDIFSRMMQVYVRELAIKINAYKKHDSYIIQHGFYDDPTMVKQRKLGFYGWVEMVNADETKEVPYHRGA